MTAALQEGNSLSSAQCTKFILRASLRTGSRLRGANLSVGAKPSKPGACSQANYEQSLFPSLVCPASEKKSARKINRRLAKTGSKKLAPTRRRADSFFSPIFFRSRNRPSWERQRGTSRSLYKICLFLHGYKFTLMFSLKENIIIIN